MSRLVICDHPLIQHKLTLIRDKHTRTKDFRQLVDEVAMLMAYEITRELPLENVEIDTPIANTKGKQLAGRMLGLIPILRAGLGMVEGILRLHPTAKVGHIGLYRDPKTLEPVAYYEKLPEDVLERDLIVVDPMLATGGTAIAAIERLKQQGCKNIKLLCLIASPEGVKALQAKHPDVEVYTAAVDEYLNDKGYIVPGLGDAGDRLFGTQ